ncbi:uncharacterized protein (DUF2336 family) [Tepidamorphus gemmatus]|uniref:Uncharacterized protein (DUF2336 family) n=1 Tax=Tepidamorphus gemmatus TaxID=747076 RepID=A0A4R3LUH9_9HYPH|nr:DUF2336 domain-containing protein [Tepidamorphus gemmatus]TCT04164.1 uncharacterized protein (DUF2336 family) [Tepidamorphus gemmatus]
MVGEFESRFQQALNSLAERRAPVSGDVRATAVTTLAELLLDSARIGNRDLPEHFSALMLALLPRVELATRREVSRRLAHCDLVPPEVARLLARDLPEVAGPMLRQSPVLSREDLDAAATGDCDEKARAVAGRADLDGELIDALIARGDPGIAAALAMAPGRLDAARAERLALTPGLGRTAAQRLVERAQLSEAALAALFWPADTATRRAIIDQMRSRLRDRNGGAARLAPTPPTRRDPAAETLASSLFALAAAGERLELAARLGDALDLPREIARRIVDDPGGEPLAVAARAADLPTDRITGIVLLTVTEAGTSLDGLRRLVELADWLEREVATTMVTLWSGAGQEVRRTVRHEPAIARPAARAVRPAQPPRRLEDVIADAMRRSRS